MECQARFRQKKIVQRNTGNRAQHTTGVTAGKPCGEQHPQHIEHNNVITRKVQLQEKEADERDAAQDACGDQQITDRRQKRTGEQLPSRTVAVLCRSIRDDINIQIRRSQRQFFSQ